MSTPHPADEAVRELMLIMPRLVGRVKRLPPPEELRSFDLAPRHLSLLSLLLLDGPQTVSELAAHLSVAPTTVSLIVGDLSRKGVLVRRADDTDRRRRIVDISPGSRPAISQWLSPGALAWRRALAPLTPAQRRIVVDTLRAYESAVTNPPDLAPPEAPAPDHDAPEAAPSDAGPPVVALPEAAPPNVGPPKAAPPDAGPVSPTTG